jgi:hypothetical protein
MPTQKLCFAYVCTEQRSLRAIIRRMAKKSARKKATKKKPAKKATTKKKVAAKRKKSAPAKRKSSRGDEAELHSRRSQAELGNEKPNNQQPTTKPQPRGRPKGRKNTGRSREAAYQAHRDQAAQRARQQSAGAREIGSIPPVADPDRRAECEQDLQLALETYFPDVFCLQWSPQHIEVINALYQTLNLGGLFALGMPRGSGKTSLCVHAGILAMCYGWRHYLALIGATAEAAYEMLDIIKVQLETNELLLADFPEVCYPVWQLEGISQRAAGQTCNGEPTGIHWSGRRKIVLPTIYERGKAIGGRVVQAVGLLGRIRGMMHVTPAGKSIRPNVFLGDDLQTDQSAKKVEQVERRETLMNGAVMGLCGPGQRMAGLATMTIVLHGDFASRMLDRKQNPRWQGRTFSLVEQWPVHTELWEKYAELREIDMLAGKAELPKATAFYRDNQKMMDAGARVPWQARKEPHEISALQSAYNLWLANPTSFDAEYQNNPQVSNTAIGQVKFPSSDEIVTRTNGLARLDIPVAATRLFTAIDVQQDVLFYLQLALSEDFTGWIIDYGAYPSQPLGNYWTLGDLQVSLRTACQVADIQAAWYAGLTRLLTQLYSREYTRDDNSQLQIDQTIIDANYGDSSKIVYQICRQNEHRPLPFHGRGITARNQPIAQRKKKPGERTGEEWFMPATRGTKQPRHVISDTNTLKTMIARRFAVPIGAGGDWTLFDAPLSAHRMFADQASSEYPVETEGRGRKLLEWQLLPGRDNHYLDCLVMAGTLGLMAGCSPSKTLSPARKPKSKKTLAQLRAEALARKRRS